MQVSPYLHYKGQCEEAFEFYAKVLGREIITMMRWEGSPMAKQAPPGWGSKIIHATLKLGQQEIGGSDAPPSHYQPPAGFSVTLNFTNDAEADRIFAALSEGGKVTMPIQKTYWASRFGMATDRFGIPWMINSSQAS